MVPYDADSMYSLGHHMQKIHAFVVCPSTKGCTDQQLIAGRAIQASFSWLNREREDVESHKERRLARSGSTMAAAITPVVFCNKRVGFDRKGRVVTTCLHGTSSKVDGETTASHHSEGQ